VLTVGSVVAGYRIERVLGSGGMGSVYLAANPTLPRLDALKVLSAELSRDDDFRARFVREADVAAALDHPQIVSVYNRGETDDGQLWIAMQFVDGTDADDALRGDDDCAPRGTHHRRGRQGAGLRARAQRRSS
jgi:serine/threonine protein kinase